MIHVVLFEPEIPQNTGNIMRTCMAMHAQLHLIEPMGFSLDEKHLKRAGMDYIKELNYTVYSSIEDFFIKQKDPLVYYVTRYAKQSPDEIEFSEHEDVYLMFGKESTGIPLAFLKGKEDYCLRLPMVKEARSLNLSNCVAIVVYEASKQLGYQGLRKHESIKGKNFIENSK